MVAPITGPFVRQSTGAGQPMNTGHRPTWYYVRRTWYRQKKPYNLPLQFYLDKRQIETYSSTDNANYKDYTDCPTGVHQPTYDWAYAKCYERFKNAIKGDTSEMAVTLAERRQALEMVSARSIQLLRFTRAVKQFRFGDAANILGIGGPPSNLRKRGRDFGSNWLEFHFGWSPLIGDIGNSMQLLCRGLPPFRIRSRASVQTEFRELIGSGFTTTRRFNRVTARWTIGADVQVSNPNTLLLNQLGFVNPVTIAWELVPFSFVLDWFVNVNDVLGSFTDFWGVSLHRPFITLHHEWWRESHYFLNPSQEKWGQRSIIVSRVPGTPPGPALRTRAPWRLSPTRALTSVSLLLQQLR